jgi:hypothetical protein
MKNLLMIIFAGTILITTANAKTNASLERIPVTDVSGYLFNGNFEVKRFVARDGQIWAVGLLTGIVSGKQITHGVQMPVTLTGGTPESTSSNAQKSGKAIQVKNANMPPPAMDCDILNVAFGPTDITVLGFHLVLAPVDIDLTAEDAPADILCAITNLLGAVSGVLNTIASLLNTLLGGLGGL